MIDTFTLTELAKLNLTTEQMAVVLNLIARAVQPLEARREADRARQSRYKNVSANVSITSHEQRENNVIRACDVENNNNLFQENIKKNLPLSPSKPKVAEPPEFIEFLEAFPPRDGGIDRKGSLKAFHAARKRASFEEIMTGASEYRQHCHAKGKLNTQYVCQPRTWLNNDRWKETYGTPATNGTTEQESARRFLEEHNAKVAAGRRG